VNKRILGRSGIEVSPMGPGSIWAQSERTVPIPGFKTVAQVTENAEAMEYGSLSPEQVEEIERLLSPEEGDA